MALPIFQRNVVDAQGNILPGAQVTVRDEATGNLVTLFSDREGNTALSNPFFADAQGLAVFYSNPGEYRIDAVGAGGTVTWRYVQLIDTQDITTIGDNFTDIETVADNIQAIIDAPQAATNAANSATSAANSATAASNSADDAATSAASVNAANIVHAPGTGLPNELDDLAAIKGGNTGALTIGTNDATHLALETNNAERMRIDNAGNVLIGTSTTGGPADLNNVAHTFNVQNTAQATPQAVIKGGLSAPSGSGGASRGSAQVTHWVKAIPVAGTGARLVIPFIFQNSLNQTTIVKVLVREDLFNGRATSRNFEATFTVGHLNTLSNLASWGLGGNIASITTSGMDVRLNVTSTFTSGASIVVYLQVMSYQNAHSVDYANIRVE